MKLIKNSLPIILCLIVTLTQAQSLKEKMHLEKVEYQATGKKSQGGPALLKPHSKQKKITTTVIVYTENDSNTISKCLESVLSQKHRNYHIICLLNKTTDDSATKINALNNPKIEMRQFDKPMHKLECLYQTIHSCSDQTVIVLVDAKDYLPNDQVLAKLHAEYNTHDTWLTFGASAANPQGSNIGLRNGIIPQEIIDTGAYRKIFPYMPTRSFYAWLFKLISKDDLIDPETNTFYEHAPECYFIWPMVEMAATHTKIFTEKTYVVNCTDPVYSLTQDYYLRRACNSQIGRSLPVYQPLD